MIASAVTFCAFLLLGLLLGGVHFAGLAMEVRALTRRGGWIAVFLPLMRFVPTVAGLFLAAKVGAAPLLAAAAGFVVARALAPRIYARFA